MKTIQDFIKHQIEVLNSKYPNAIPIFGGALWVYNNNNFDNQCFMVGLHHVVQNAKFFKICMVDPMIFEELCSKT